MWPENKIRIELRNVGNRDGDSSRLYGYCEYGSDSISPQTSFILFPTTNTLLEEYRGYEIRLYTGGKYFHHVKIETIISDWSSDEYEENPDIIITCRGTSATRATMFAKIQPPLIKRIPKHWWERIFPWGKRREYTSVWMTDPETELNVRLAIEYLKSRIDEIWYGRIVSIDPHGEQVGRLIDSIKNPRPPVVENNGTTNKPKEEFNRFNAIDVVIDHEK